MDPAQEIELHALRLQEPMNAVIERGDSAVQQFYCGATVFVTGGFGFIGKQLIEKLFRSCAVKKMYLLARAKKGRTIQERLQHMLQDPLYDRLREQQPKFADKIVPVEGDVASLKLGLSDTDWTMLTEQVNIIFHAAATVRFDEPLRKATVTNVRGTREALALAKQCSQFKKFIHVSTAFTHATKKRIDTDILEQFYPCPVPPDAMIALAEDVDENRLDGITNDLIEGWPNTYTFTKALAEELIRTSAGDLPVCIVRPPVVLPAYYEPSPGWLDTSTVVGPSGLYLGGGLGVLRVLLSDAETIVAVAPVDYVNNAIIAAGWDSAERRKNGETEIPIFTILRNIRLGSIRDTIKSERKRLSSPRAIWYCGTNEIKSEVLYFFLSWFWHYIPAYILDFVFGVLRIAKPPGITSFVDIFKKLDKLSGVYNYFTNNDWNFKDDNIRAMIARMSSADKAIFNCDLDSIDLKEYILVWGIGLRKYIIKDGLTGTAAAYKRQQILRIPHYIAVVLYAYALWFVFSTIYLFVKNLLLIIIKEM